MAPVEIDEQTKHSWRRRRNDHSAGGVAYRPVPGDGFEIALIATRSGTRWQLPKGTCERGETAEQTAIREVAEEVGLKTACECFLHAIEYWYWDTYRKETPELVHKRVDFFLLRVTGGEVTDASFEVDSTAWFTPAQAMEVLTFASEKDVVQLAIEQLKPGRTGADCEGCTGKH